VPTWLYIFGHALGQPRAEVAATFARPFPAILTALVLIIGMRHFARGSTAMIEDYAHGTARKAGIVFVYSLAGVLAATGLYALIKIAL
jgi:succinate dehydrogenase / fumarate reductase membrane anchor subunit